MKKLLALALLLALMLPACALGFELSRSGGSILTPIQNSTDGCYVYTLEAGQSYTMSGDSDDGVRLHLIKDSGGSTRAITLIMNGVDISSSSSNALAVFSNGVPLNIIPFPDKTNRVHSASVPGSGLLISGADVTVSGSGTLSASAFGYSCHGLCVEKNSTLSVCGGTLSVSASGDYSHGLYAVDGSTVNVSGGTLSASASNAYGYGLYAENNSTVNVTGGRLSVSAEYVKSIGVHAPDSVLTVGSEGNFDAYGTDSAFASDSVGNVVVQGEGRDLFGRNSVDEDWAEYEYGMKYALVMHEDTLAPEGPTGGGEGGGLINPGVVVPGGAIPMPDGAASDLPKTGDPSTLSAWACVMLSALGALALMKMRRALR